MLPGRVLAAASILLCVLTAGCAAGGVPTPRAAEHDRPVPSSEPRGELSLVVDLARASDCEERFDLAVYAHHGIDLIQWDSATGACGSRRVIIRFLPNRISAEEAQRLAQKHSLGVKQAPTEKAKP